MEVMQAILDRRSIRKYDSRPIEQEKLDKIAEAFRQSPSARNAQNWKMIIVRSPYLKERIKKATLAQNAFIDEAPVMLVYVGTNPGVMSNGHRADSIDLSIGVSYSILEAWELGLGTCWMASYREDWVREALDLPEDMSVVAITPLGYPAEQPDAKPRKPLAEVVEYR
jgi:nitroreductase